MADDNQINKFVAPLAANICASNHLALMIYFVRSRCYSQEN